ncbi:ABC transporter substrate-binding protein [Mucisphaera sp.]|uniref:ABC transporter substrate-binding protein n=1 Tax=Mucisphaera sp. TaxID=2913024 RepID=UPI003D118798
MTSGSHRSLNSLARLTGLICLLTILTACGEQAEQRTADGRIILNYWEKWNTFEAEAMRRVVDDYNASQDRVLVKFLSVSSIDQKVLLATAGGNPPDIAGLWSYLIPSYAEKNALTPLDGYVQQAGIQPDDYYPTLWDAVTHRGFVWALPSTPATVALHYNKQSFREAGLDPEQPPTSIAELDAMAEKLTIVELTRDGQKVQVRYTDMTDQEKSDLADDRKSSQFRIMQLGHSPTYPGWWLPMWGYWWDASLVNEEGTRVTPDSQANIEAMQWIASYTRKYGRNNILAFGSSFGNFGSPQEPFLTGQIAMVIQGVWMYNFVDQFAPRLEWGVAPFPSADPENIPNVTVIDCDVLVVPKGARYPDEAFAFIRYVNTQGPMEKLCLGHRKFSPLVDTSERFLQDHPNPYIQTFIDLAASPNARTTPLIPLWLEYNTEMNVNINSIYRGSVEPHEGMARVRDRIQKKLDRAVRRWNLTSEARLAEWQQYRNNH